MPGGSTATNRRLEEMVAQGQFREAEQRLRTARRLDALSPMVGINFAELYFYQGNFAREETELRAVLALNPNFIVARMMLANALPRPGYVYRVAQVFANNGAGVRGDLKAVVLSILKDYEARTTDKLRKRAPDMMHA